MGEYIMKKKKVHSLIIGLMLVVITLVVAPTINATSFHAVKGTLYIDDVVADPGVQIEISIPTKSFTTTVLTTQLDVNGYNFYAGFDQSYAGDTVHFKVTYMSTTYTPTENESLVLDKNINDIEEYIIDLYISTSPPSDDDDDVTPPPDDDDDVTPPPSDDDDDTGGGGGGGGGAPPAAILAKPNADAGGPYYGVVDEEVTVDGSGSTDTDGTVEEYRWDFDNDGTWDADWSSSPTATHTYTVAGDYTVKLEVKDDDGKTDTDTATATISQLNLNPTDPVVSGTTDGSVDTNYTYMALSSDPDGDNIKYVFDWGDGTNTSETAFVANNTEGNATHQWSAADMYIMGVYAEDVLAAISGTTNYFVFIDVDYIEIDDVIDGYLIDNDQDGTYDEFYNTGSEQTNNVEKQEDGAYLIDANNNGEWDEGDYVYNTDGTITEYTEEEPTTGDETEEEADNTMLYVAAIIIIIILILLLLLGTKKKGKKKETKKK
jgi:hypothetical protein